MSGGYTPLFSSLTTGTLCGKWPDIGLWPIILSLADKHGVVDVTCHYIAGVTGLKLVEVEACMERFCGRDTGSRSADAEGARLVLLDSHRDWGWRIVNFAKYREKARLLAKNAQEIEDGRNAQRMAHRRGPPTTAADRRKPPVTDPSDADADADSNADGGREEGATAPPSRARVTASRLPEDFALTPERRQVAVAEGVDPERTFAKFTDYWRAASGAKARKLDWDATWRNWCRNDADRQPGGQRGLPAARPRLRTADEIEADERRRAQGGGSA
jgi:hypothetical protein